MLKVLELHQSTFSTHLYVIFFLSEAENYSILEHVIAMYAFDIQQIRENFQNTKNEKKKNNSFHWLRLIGALKTKV